MPHLPRETPPMRGVPPEISAAIERMDSRPASPLALEQRSKTRRIGLARLSLQNWTVDPLKIAQQLMSKGMTKDEYTGRLQRPPKPGGQ